MPTQGAQRGFSLVELMVGIVITLIASVIMFQIFALAERNKRTTTGASDAQTNGALALFVLEREVRMAGFGFAGGALKDCDPAMTHAYYSPDPSAAKNDLDFGGITQPVRIIDGNSAKPADRILLAMSGSDILANFTIGRTNLRDSMAEASAELKVESVHGCGVGSLVLMVQPCAIGGAVAGSCSVMEITGVNEPALTLQHQPSSSAPTWNPREAYQTANGWPVFKMSESCKAYGICMPAPKSAGLVQFAISDRQLTSQRVDPAGNSLGTAEILAPEIMDLQVQYGLSATPSGTPAWQDPTGDWAGTPVPPAVLPAVSTTQRINAIKAIRLAIVARSGEYEKPLDAQGNCDTTTAAPSYSWGSFDTTRWPEDWQCYRYKVFETVIPLINVIWAKV